MKVFIPTKHTLHNPAWYLADGTARAAPDRPGRIESMREALQALPALQLLAPPPTLDPLPAVLSAHTRDYVEFLRTIYPIWSAEFPNVDVLPDTFPRHLPRTKRPAKPSAQVGFYCFDMAAPITAGTWDAVLDSARCAVAAASELVAGGRAAYSLSRPPGHHAGADYCGGFCYLNNAAIAAQHLLLNGLKRVAILDVDYHHGNGTQDIFYDRSDVLFVSIHADPNTQYPYFWGHADETGNGAGEGFNLNFPLRRGVPAGEWFAALEAAFKRILTHAPEALIISLGVDTYVDDKVGDFQLSFDDFSHLGRKLSSFAHIPTLFIQEGGYNLEAVGNCVAQTLRGFLNV